MSYVKSKRVSLKGHPELTEKWLQQRISDDVELLGLGELDVKDIERRQPRAGRLDMLLYDAETNTRYEVEIQLGATDESHIIRTLEYWDNERRRFPQYEHVAVIVAEEITGRFLNVINLFNQAIPLIAIEMSALQVGDDLTLHATRVLDLALPAPEEEDDPGQETDRSYWQQKSSPEIMRHTDELLGLVNDTGAAMSLKYNKHYIGLARNGNADNFVQFVPRRKHVNVHVRLDRSEELDARLEEAGLPLIAYDKRFRYYRATIEPAMFQEHRDTLLELFQEARDASGTTDF